MTEPTRADCPRCKKSVALKKDGTLWNHVDNGEPDHSWGGGRFKKRCKGSGEESSDV